MNITPGVTPNPEPHSVEFVQSLKLETQLTPLLGSAASWSHDSEVQSHLSTIRGKAKESAERLAKITADLTVTPPVMHNNAFKVASELANTAEATQRFLEGRAKDYMAWSNEIMDKRLSRDPAKEARYTKVETWIAEQAKNGDGGYRNIREAIEEDPEFAQVAYNTSYRILGLPKDHALDFAEKAVKRWAPEALEYIDRASELERLAKKYPAFVQSVHASFYSKHELAKMATRFNG